MKGKYQRRMVWLRAGSAQQFAVVTRDCALWLYVRRFHKTRRAWLPEERILPDDVVADVAPAERGYGTFIHWALSMKVGNCL